MIRFLLSVAIAVLTFAPISFAASPYVHEQSRSIKALSDQEMADYAAGKGMGFAKAAELNGYPGPAHVLELADELTLSPLQRERTAALFRRMQMRAGALGARLVDEERTLDELFASKAISREALARALSSIAALQSEIRATHLRAHLEQAEILSAAQAMKYGHLRGYDDNSAPSRHKH
jgi:Spy/CpxP family protein refolding chaperone